MNHSELLLRLKDKLTPKQGFAFNEKLVARHKREYLKAQQYNKDPVIISPDNTNPIWEEYPPTPPFTRPDTNNNQNNYYAISKFKISLREFLPRKNKK